MIQHTFESSPVQYPYHEDKLEGYINLDAY